MKPPQRGFSLISLMIGLTLSLISVLTMLALYKNMIGVSVRSIQDARQDGQVAAGLLTAQQELRNAGFWITDTPIITNSIKLLVGATLTNGTLSASSNYIPPAAGTNGNAVVWVYKSSSSAAITCAGLLVQNGQLIRLKGASSCTQISNWSTTTWTGTVLVDAPQALADQSGYANTQSSSFFQVVSDTCWPFGKTAQPTFPAQLKVIMTAATSTKDSSDNAVSISSEICLPNLPTS